MRLQRERHEVKTLLQVKGTRTVKRKVTVTRRSLSFLCQDDAHVFRDFLGFALSSGSQKLSEGITLRAVCSATVGETGCLALNRIEAVKAHSVLPPKESGHNATKTVVPFFFFVHPIL